MRRLRIALVNDLLPPDHEGGLELSAFEIGQALRESGHDVQFLCCEWRSTYTGSREELHYMHRLFKYAEVRARDESNLPRKLESFRAVERKINIAATNYRILGEFLQHETHFDVALVFGVQTIGLGTIRAFSDHDVPVVWSVGDVAIPVHFSMPNQTRLYKMVFGTIGKKWHDLEKRVDFRRMMFVSEFSRQEMFKAGFTPELAQVVPRAVNFEPVDPDARDLEDPPTLFVACRLAPARGAHVAIEAAKLLHAARPDLKWQLKIAGGGIADYVHGLHESAAELGPRIQFLGKLPKTEVIEQMKRSVAFINPTVEVEGFGRSNIEAMACGACLVTTDIPSVHEIVDENGCALLFPSGDAQALSDHLEELLGNAALRRELSHKGIERVRQRYLMRELMVDAEKVLLSAAKPVLNQ